MEQLWRADPIVYVWWATRVECASALARRAGLPEANQVGIADSWAQLARHAPTWREIQPTIDLRDVAVSLLTAHPLRAADAFQLAAALIASREADAPLPFVCLDNRLRAAAGAEGLALVP
jgi:predicted nucleic acid-binding protein